MRHLILWWAGCLALHLDAFSKLKKFLLSANMRSGLPTYCSLSTTPKKWTIQKNERSGFIFLTWKTWLSQFIRIFMRLNRYYLPKYRTVQLFTTEYCVEKTYMRGLLQKFICLASLSWGDTDEPVHANWALNDFKRGFCCSIATYKLV